MYIVHTAHVFVLVFVFNMPVCVHRPSLLLFMPSFRRAAAGGGSHSHIFRKYNTLVFTVHYIMYYIEG